MFKLLLLECIRSYLDRKKKPYLDYFSYLIIVIGIVGLFIANYFYFYLDDHGVGNYLAFGTLFITAGFMVQGYSFWLRQRPRNQLADKLESLGESLKSITLTDPGKLIPVRSLTYYLPKIIKFTVIGYLGVIALRIAKKIKL